MRGMLTAVRDQCIVLVSVTLFASAFPFFFVAYPYGPLLGTGSIVVSIFGCLAAWTGYVALYWLLAVLLLSSSIVALIIYPRALIAWAILDFTFSNFELPLFAVSAFGTTSATLVALGILCIRCCRWGRSCRFKDTGSTPLASSSSTCPPCYGSITSIDPQQAVVIEAM